MLLIIAGYKLMVKLLKIFYKLFSKSIGYNKRHTRFFFSKSFPDVAQEEVSAGREFFFEKSHAINLAVQPDRKLLPLLSEPAPPPPLPLPCLYFMHY